MTIACPPFIPSLVIAGDAQLAAQISCALAVPGHYLPVIEGPRLLHPDSTAELARRNNAAGRARPQSIFMTGLSDEPYNAQMAIFADALKTRARRISTLEEINRLRALSRCRTKNATRVRLVYFQAAATASRQVFIAAARKVRCVWADTRWRWTLKML